MRDIPAARYFRITIPVRSCPTGERPERIDDRSADDGGRMKDDYYKKDDYYNDDEDRIKMKIKMKTKTDER